MKQPETKNWRIAKSAFSWLAVVLFVAALQWRDDANLVHGLAPELSGVTSNGASFPGRDGARPRLIYFWASWCGICAAMADTIGNVSADVSTVTIALQSGGPDDIRRHLADRASTFPPVLADEQGKLATAFGVRGVPAVFVLNRAGEIRFANTGYMSEAGLRLRLWMAER